MTSPTTDGRSGRWATAARLKAAVITLTFVATGATAALWASDGNHLEPLDNPAGLYNFTELESVSAAGIDALGSGPYGPFLDDRVSEPIGSVDSGPAPNGNFRLICTVSHFGYDDPIIFPGKPGAAHLHMFWGNTFASAHTFNSGVPTPGDNRNLIERGSSTCQGGAANRSAYWAPAMIAGSGPSRKIVMPKQILLYYKSQKPLEVQGLPVGIQLLVGNVAGYGNGINFDDGEWLSWGCYNSATGIAQQLSSTIPGADAIGTANDAPACPDGMDIRATIQFPQCIATDNGLSTGEPVLTNPDFVSHTHMLYNFTFNYGLQNDDCPASHPYRVPQISYLINWENPAGLAESSWRLSSDQGSGNAQVAYPGGSLHGDWLGGWNPKAIDSWMDGCFNPAPRNCSLGQTGQNGTGRRFKPITGTNLSGMNYIGPQLLDDPEPGFVLIP